MKNLFTNLMKNTAKRTQNTGGGTSHEKNSAVAVWNDSRTTVKRRSNDGQSQRQYSLGMMKYPAMILMLFCLGTGEMWGQTTIYNTGWEGGIGTWTGSGGLVVSEETTNVRTGSKAVKGDYTGSTSAKNLTQATGTTTTSEKATYCHIIGWAKAETGSATTAQIGFNSSKKSSAVTLSSSSWTQITYKGNEINATTIIIYKGGAKTGAYFDDVVSYYSSSSTTDVTAPSAATSASATTSSISWTNGTDSGTGATGRQTTSIWRRTSGSSDNLTLNNQGIYAALATDQSGSWTCVSATVAKGTDAATSSYAGTFSEGDRYAIVHRDLAYNYSTPTYVTVAGGGGGGATTYDVTIADLSNGSITASPTSQEEGEDVTLTVSPSTGYELSGDISVTGDESGDNITATDNGDGTWTFEMPGEDVTVDASFSLIDYSVSKTLTYCAVKDGSTAIPSTMNYGDDLSTTIEPLSGYLLPSSITVSGVTSYTWNALTGALTLTDVTGNVSISIVAATPQTGSGATVTYAMVTSGSTDATYSTGVFTGILSNGTPNKNTLVASNTLSGGNGVAVQSDKTTPKSSRTAGITSSTDDFSAGSSPYAEFTFDVVDGYTFTPTAISVPVLAITNNAYFTAIVTDGSSTWTSATSECTQGAQATINATPSGGSALTGTVNIRVFCHNQATAAKGFRFGTGSVTVTGTVAVASSGPSVSSFTPASGATVKSGATVTVAGSSGSTVYYLWGTSTPPANAAAVVSSGTAGTAAAGTVTTTGISSSNTYLYAVAKDGEEVSDISSANYTIDDTAPTLSSSTPANGATGVTASGNIVLTFSENVTIIDASKFSLSGGTGTLSTGSATASGSAVTIPYSGLANSTTYTLSTAAGAVKDAVGNTSAALSDISFTTVAGLTAISADTKYEAASMSNNGGSWSGSDTPFTGLSTNNLFNTYGATSPTNVAAKGKTISSTSVTDDIGSESFTSVAYILSSSNTSSTSDPTEGAIEFITPSTAGILYIYLENNNSDLTLKKQGSSTSSSLSGANYKAMAVDASSHYFINGVSSGKRGLYGIKYVSTYAVDFTGCSNVTKVTGDASAVKGKAYTATFTAAVGYTLPETVTVKVGGVTKTVTTDYTWSVSDGTGTLTILAANTTGAVVIDVDGESLPTYTITYNKGTGDGITGSHSSDDKTEDVALTLPDVVFSRSGQTQIGWATSDGGDLAYNLGASYTTDADVDLYPVWADNCYSMVVSTSGSAPAVDDNVSGTQSGGTMTIQGLGSDGSMTYEANGIKFSKSGDEVKVTLQNKMKVGTVIVLTIYGGSGSRGLNLKASDGTAISSLTWNTDVSDSKVLQYTVAAGDTKLIGSKVFRLARNNSVWLTSVVVANGAPITYDLTVAVSPAGYGSVSPTSVTDIPASTTTSSSTNTFTVNGTTVTATPTAATAEYTYAFSSWSSLPATVTADATVTANFTRTANSYSLAWNTNGGSDLAGSPTSGTTAYGTSLTKPTEPTKSNYSFAGWNTANDGSGTNNTGAMTMPAANTTYYAKWTQTVTLNANTANNGSGDNSSATAVWNATGLTGFSVTSAATDYSVIGYYTGATDGTKVLNADGSFADTDIDGYVTDGKWARTGAAPTLYAHLIKVVNVTYDGNSATSGDAPTDANDYVEGDEVTVLGNTGSLTKTSKVFNGWNTAADGSGTFYPVGSKFSMPNDDVTLYAVWSSKTETMYYYGSVKITDGALVKGMSGASVQFFTYASSTFANSTALSMTSAPSASAPYSETTTVGSWTSESNWTTSQSGNRYISGVSFGNGSTYTLALGTKVASSIRFVGYANHNNSRTMTIGGVSHETSNNSLFSYEYTKAGDFTGNVTITETGEYRGILIITAYTIDGAYDVTFSANTEADVDNMPSTIANVPSGSKISEPLDIPTRSGYIFDSWCTDKEGETEYNFSTGTITAATTLYAKWTAKTNPTQYTVSVDNETICVADEEEAKISLSGSQSGISYQLYADGVAEGDPVAGTGSALSNAWTVAPEGAVEYTVKTVENATYASIEMSNSVTVQDEAPHIQTQPTNMVNAIVGVSARLEGLVVSGVSLSYQWKSCATKDGSYSNVAGGTSAVLVVTPAATGATYYKCEISSSCGDAVTTNAVKLTASSDLDDCYPIIAGVTRTDKSATAASTEEGIMYGSYKMNGLSTDGKLNGEGAYFYVALSSGNYYQDGDSVFVTLNKTGGAMTIQAGGKVPGAVVATLASGSVSASSVNKLVLSNVPANTDTITIFRSSTYVQNHQIDRIEVRRYMCAGTSIAAPVASGGSWSNTADWTNGQLPTIDDAVILTKPMTVDVDDAQAAEIILDQSSSNTGKLTIQANMGLEVAGTVQVYNGSSYGPTTPADLVLESSADGNASLIFNNNNECQATVQMYSKSVIANENTWNWQYIGSPYVSASALHNYYGCYLKKWGDPAVGWNDVASGASIEPWKAYSITQESTSTFVMEGTLVPTDNSVELDIPAKPSWIIANSWTAPIYIDDMDDAFDEETEKTVYLFNTGFAPSGTSMATTGSEESRYAAGTYLSVPVNSAVSIGNPFISSMQGFVVKNTTSPRKAIKLTLDYATMVRPTADRGIAGGPMHAPKRVKENEENPNVLKMLARGRNYDDCLFFLERPDFTTGFDNGWDGSKLGDNAVAPRLYTTRDDGTKESVSAVPELEGSIVTFRAGEDNEYTFHFEYNEEAETLYLLDMDKNIYTRVLTGNTYTFITSDKVEHPRFMLTRYNAPAITTGVDEAQKAGSARKQMINGTLYIIRDGRIYNAEGAMVK